MEFARASTILPNFARTRELFAQRRGTQGLSCAPTQGTPLRGGNRVLLRTATCLAGTK
jgi:hypothetical protein